MPTQAITNPGGAFPAGNQTSAAALSIGVGVYYTAVVGTTITTVPATVAITTDGLEKVATAATNGNANLLIGIAVNAAVAGKTTDVVAHGVVKSVPVDGTVGAGDILKQSVTTAGRLAATATPALGEVVGVALAASASNVVDVFVNRQQGH